MTREMTFASTSGRKARVVVLLGLAGTFGFAVGSLIAQTVDDTSRLSMPGYLLVDLLLRNAAVGGIVGGVVALSLVLWGKARYRIAGAVVIGVLAYVAFAWVGAASLVSDAPWHVSWRTVFRDALMLITPVVVQQTVVHHLFLTRKALWARPWLLLVTYLACGLVGVIPAMIWENDLLFLPAIGVCLGYFQLFAIIVAARYEIAIIRVEIGGQV